MPNTFVRAIVSCLYYIILRGQRCTTAGIYVGYRVERERNDIDDANDDTDLEITF